MNYFKSLFYNFLVVFFADYVLPGMEISEPTRLPQFGGDFPFAIALGFLNSLIYPILKIIGVRSAVLKIALLAIVLNFAAYAILKTLSIGIQVASVEGYFLTSAVVAVGSFLINLFNKKHGHRSHTTTTTFKSHEPDS